MAKKFTIASAKSFIKKNITTLKIKVTSDFNGMTDSVEFNSGAKFTPITLAERFYDNNQGVAGVWFVGGSRDYFTPKYSGETITGFECDNSCGSFELSIL